MKAVVRDQYGSAAMLRIEDVDTPSPVADQVLVRVHAASLNAADLDFLHGRPAVLRLASGMRRPRNRRIGVDVAGRVEAVGDGVTRFRPGDEVFADMFSFGMGSLAEYVCAPERAFVAKPASMTMEEAAAFPHAGVLALQSIRAGRPIRPGERVLINGASGNVGPFAIQIAKADGATVTGVCRTAKVDFVRAIGADDVIDYTRESFSRSGRRWDRILDVAAGRSIFEVRRALAPQGIYTWIGGSTGTLVGALFIGSAMSLIGRQRLGLTFAWKPFRAEDVATLVAMFEAGTIRPIIDRRVRLDEVPDAVRAIEDGDNQGKIIVAM